jgi:hypothetical protein
MKKLILACLVFSSSAQAHKVPYDFQDPALQCLADNGQEALAENIAHYCFYVAKPLAECVGDLKKQDAIEFAGQCQKGFASLPFDPTLAHMAGSPGCENGYWHNEYVYHKELGWHKHTWSPTTRDAAGREVGTMYVQQLKSNWESTSSTEGTGTSTGGHATATAETKGISNIFVKATGEFGMEHKKDTSASTTTQGPSQGQINAVYKRGYTAGYSNPQLSSYRPDVFCKQGDKLCGSPQGLVPDPDSAPKPEPAKPEPSKHCKPTAEPPQSKAPTYPDFSPPVTPAEPAKVSDAGPLHKDETYTDDILIAGIIPTFPDTINPLEECVAQLKQQEIQQGYEYSEGPKKSKKQYAEEELALGHCVEEYYGAEFCRQFYAEKYTTKEPAKDEPQPEPDIIPGWVDFGPPEEVPTTADDTDTTVSYW